MEYITVKEAAKKWGYCEGTIRKWCKEGLLSVTYEAEKCGNYWRIPKDAVCPKKIKSEKGE